MKQPRRRWLAIAIVASAAVIPAATALAAKITTRSATIQMPPGAASQAIATCPSGTLATGGGGKVADDSDYVTGSAPLGKREWLAAGWDDGGLTAYARCTRGKGLKLVSRSRTAVLPADGNGAAVTARCPKGTQVAGGGARLGDDYDDYLIASHPVGRRAWRAAGWRSAGGAGSTVTATARCLKRAKLRTAVKSVAVPPGAGIRSVTARCPKGTKSTGGGFRLAIPDGDYARASYPSGGRGWTARADRGQVDLESSILSAYARCLAG